MSGLQQEELDVYGFPLTGATQQQRSARAACAAYEARRRVKWQIYVQNQQLPTGPTLKRYCRKVSSLQAAGPQHGHTSTHTHVFYWLGPNEQSALMFLT